MSHFVQTLVVCAVIAPAAAQQTPETQAPKPAEAKKPEPPKEKTFAEIVKDAKEIKGLFTLWQTDEKVYLEVLPDQLDKIYMLSLTADSGIGERGFYAAAMTGETPILLRKRAKNLQFVAKNPRFRAAAGTPMSRFVERSFSDSTLGLAKIESLPHPERKSVLIDLGSVLLTDLPMMSYALESTFRIPYRFDGKNSSFRTVKSYDRNVEIGVEAYYAVDRPPVPPLRMPGAPAPPTPPRPRNLADIRGMFFLLRYSLSELPPPGYRARLADDRIGHFFDQVEDFTSDVEHTPARRLVNRWRLEKEDPNASISRPKQPIVFWLENTIPVAYRPAIRDGILMWNRAFERIGFRDAVVVKEQPDDAEWDAADVRYNTIRWFAGTDAGFAQGPSRTNPYTGEIYDADIRFSESMVRFRRQTIVLQQNPLANPWDEQTAAYLRAPWGVEKGAMCTFAAEAARDAEFAWDVLETRGIEPDSPEADKFVYSYLREIAAHEVGHTLGLRHNFRASTIRRLDETQNASLTAKEGLTGSVMDYIPANLAGRGAKQGEYHQSTLGPYDYWAIEYAYKPLAASTPEDEFPELRRIASRAAEPALAYATDEDAGLGSGAWDMDPDVSRFDLGSDPLAYYVHRIRLSEEIQANLETALQKPGQGYQVLRRSFLSAVNMSGTALLLSAKYIGGVNHYRDHVGDPGGRLPFRPVPAARQRQALNLIRDHLFAPDAFKLSPSLLNKLNNERFSDLRNFESMATRFDVPVHDVILMRQKAVLDRLYNPVVLKRILDSELSAPTDPFRLGDLFTGVQDSVWAELKSPDAAVTINSFRRSLQREHLRRMIGMMLKDAAAPEDARTLARFTLASLKTRVQGALARPGVKMTLETRAHLAESVSRIDEALKAGMERTAF
ncbi:MAG TPA: zinc-dependent metalloprotease [Bryobacteraceae bacterium]|nr:zinc-dependent metalloprotease [Bryobacteraceae bacterium]